MITMCPHTVLLSVSHEQSEFSYNIPVYNFSAVLYLTISDHRIEDHILVTDIGHNRADSLVCWYHSPFTRSLFDWYHNINGEQGLGTEIHKKNDSRNEGWFIEYALSNSRVHQLSLMRKSSAHVKEGILSCQEGTGRERSAVSVEIHYPSKS